MDKVNEAARTEDVQKIVVVRETVSDEKFKHKGAIAFFVLLVLICVAIWYSVYYIQLMR
jgi:hypothetical protein